MADLLLTEIIDAAGDGAGNGLDRPLGIAADTAGNVYVTGNVSYNAFKITPGGVITEIIDATGDGSGSGLFQPIGIAVDDAGNVYVASTGHASVFKITPGGVITEIIDSAGDGAGNALDRPFAIAADTAGNVYVTGNVSDNAFKITPAGVITEIIDAAGDGAGNGCIRPIHITLDTAGNVYVTCDFSGNAFRITDAPVCGDGCIMGTEACDNGPDDPNDCCTASCQFASGGSSCGAPPDMAGSCFTGDACSDVGVCLTGTIVTSCIDDDLCCNRDTGCSSDNDSDCEELVPTVSTWGLLVLALLLMVTAKAYFGGRRASAVA